MSPTSTSSFIAGKPVKPEVAQKGRHYAQTKGNRQLSNQVIRNYAVLLGYSASQIIWSIHHTKHCLLIHFS